MTKHYYNKRILAYKVLDTIFKGNVEVLRLLEKKNEELPFSHFTFTA